MNEINTPLQRCAWVPDNKPDYAYYHDHEWGIPVHDDQHLFEMLILEGAQAGLSWYTILKRRDAYRQAFKGFDPVLVAQMQEDELEELFHSSGIIRNRLKVFSARQNARIFLDIQQAFHSFDAYIWGFVHHTPINRHPKTFRDIPVTSPESEALSKDLKKRGMKFVGSTIMYAMMQAIGMVNDHTEECYKSKL
jgi:DNA-3-methyladenine glycosylase I